MKTKMPYGHALYLAQLNLDQLSRACERIEIAGSLRRFSFEVGDIELVCIPKFIQSESTDLFGQAGQINLLTEHLRHMRIIKGDKKQVQVDLGKIALDIFIVTPETWGVQFTIRTGSTDFSKWMVTPRQKGGALPSHMKVKDGRVWEGERALETPEEADFFKVCGLDFIEPTMRGQGRWNR